MSRRKVLDVHCSTEQSQARAPNRRGKVERFMHSYKGLFKARNGKYRPQNCRRGDIVEVRSETEILQTLDEKGALEELPFQEEMLECCGKRFRVLSNANRMFVEGVGSRRIKNTVILEGVSCNGQAHGGCQRTCLLLWKEAWLRKMGNSCAEKPSDSEGAFKTRSIKTRALREGGFSCQLAMLPVATSRLPASFEDIVRQYMFDARVGTSEHFWKMREFLLRLNFSIQRSLGRKKYATLHGVLRKTPAVSLSLLPGDYVQVKGKEDILATLDFKGRNRGLSFTAEMLKYCGGNYRVLKRVDKMVTEKDGKMRNISNTVILEGVTCDGSDHSNCPRNCYSLWREAWLRRSDNS